jgi:small subunit ribosomal protein S16
MATRIRLRRMGSKGRPFYRVVVADQRSPRDGRFIENIGKYHPLSDPSLIEIDEERALYWLRVGAQPSNQVRNLMSKLGIWETFVKERPSATVGVKTKTERPAKEKLSKKAQAKAAESVKAAAAPAPAVEKPAAVDEPAPTVDEPAPAVEETVEEPTTVDAAVESAETTVEETAEA